MIQTFLLDAAMIFLLGMAIIFCWRLNGRMNSMKQMGKDILPAVKSLSGFVSKINDQIDTLRTQTKQTQGMLSNDIPQAKALKDDLELLLEYSESSSKHLETLIEKAKETELELKHVHEIISKSFPKNFKDSLQQGSLAIDFDEMKRLRVSELKDYEGGTTDSLSNVIIPMKIEQLVDGSPEFHIDENIRAAIGDLR